jgi:hypothetical protein
VSPVHIEDLDMNDTCLYLNFGLVANQFALDGEPPHLEWAIFGFTGTLFVTNNFKNRINHPPPPFFLHAIVSY